MCVCVCERERERERESLNVHLVIKEFLFTLSSELILSFNRAFQLVLTRGTLTRTFPCLEAAYDEELA